MIKYLKYDKNNTKVYIFQVDKNTWISSDAHKSEPDRLDVFIKKHNSGYLVKLNFNFVESNFYGEFEFDRITTYCLNDCVLKNTDKSNPCEIKLSDSFN